MKKMIQRTIGLVAALTVVLSMTAMVCRAEYTENTDEYILAPCFNEWEDDDNRD